MAAHRFLVGLIAGLTFASPAIARGVADGGEALLGLDQEVEVTLSDLGLMRGWEQQKALGRLVKNQGWKVDAGKGVLQLADGTTLRVQVFGTWVAKSNTYSWAWGSAPASIPSKAYSQSSKARFLGGAHGFEQLTSPHQKMTRDEAHALAITTSGALEGVHAVFLAPAKFGAVLLAVTDFSLDLPKPTVSDVADVLFQTIDSGMVVHQRQAVRHYLEDRGYAIEGDRLTWVAVQPDTGSIRITFSPAGRVTGIACIGVGSLECRVSDAKLAAADAKATRLGGGAASASGPVRRAGDDAAAEAKSGGEVAAFGDLSSEDMEALLAEACGDQPCPGENGIWWAGFWFKN